MSEDIHPEAANFINDIYKLKGENKQLKEELEDARSLIATQANQIDGLQFGYKEVSEKADHYMRLSVEMRTHITALRALTLTAENAFMGGLQRNNGAIVEAETEVKGDDGKPVPKFLTDKLIVEEPKKNGSW